MGWERTTSICRRQGSTGSAPGFRLSKDHLSIGNLQFMFIHCKSTLRVNPLRHTHRTTNHEGKRRPGLSQRGTMGVVIRSVLRISRMGKVYEQCRCYGCVQNFRCEPKSNEQKPSDRRSFLKRATIVGATGLFGFDGLMSLASAQPKFSRPEGNEAGVEKGDFDILIAAQIAEALAVTTYFNIIELAPFFNGLAKDDQGYLVNAMNEEMSHFLLEKSVTQTHTPFTSFFYPKGMFSSAQTTLNTLVTLEDAFIAAYLVGVRNFSTPDLRVTAARIMGIESDHRTLARVLGPDVAAANGGPIETITGLQGISRKGRSAKQQHLRTHSMLDRHQPGSHCADPIRRYRHC